MQIVLSKIVINVIVMWIILSFGLAFDALEWSAHAINELIK